MNWEGILNSIVSWVTTTGIKLVLALLILFISFKVINHVGRRLQKGFERKDIDKTIIRTAIYVGKIALKVLVTVAMIGYVGIDTSGITALIASLGVCVGLAVNGALSNIAGGVLILVTRPFKVDDYIEVQGFSGVVTEIRITRTKIITGKNKVVQIPNGALSNSTIVNLSELDARLLDMEFTLSGVTPLQAESVVSEVIKANPMVLKEREILVVQSGTAANEPCIRARAWCANENYWNAYFELTEAVKAELSKLAPKAE